MSLTDSQANAAAEMAADAPSIVYEGRHVVDATGAVRLGFPGVRVHLRFRGSAVALRAWSGSDEACFEVAVDGGAPELRRMRAGEATYRLAHGLAEDRAHTLVFARRTESWQGVCTLRGLALPGGGEWLPVEPLPGRRLLFIGDSVTGGEMAGWTPDGRAPFPAADNNALCSYGIRLAQRLGAQCHLVSYGGRGVLRDWRGRRDVPNAPQYYELALPDDPATPWDHRRYVPDGVGVQLGTNDFSQGIPDEAEFVGAYGRLLRKVRQDAPDAWIVVMDSPIVTDLPSERRRTVLRQYLDAVVAGLSDERVIRASLPICPGVPGNGHPTRAEHAAMAAELEPTFRRVMRW